MQNDTAPKPPLRSDLWEDGSRHWNALVVGAFAYGLAFFQRGPILEVGVGLWAFGYLVNFPLQIWHVRVRPEGGDPRYVAKVLALGAWPFALFIPFWAELTTRKALLVVFPIIIVSGATAMWLAWRREGTHPEAEQPQPPAPADTP